MIHLLVATDDWICQSNKRMRNRLYPIFLWLFPSEELEKASCTCWLDDFSQGLKSEWCSQTRKTYYRLQTYIGKQAETKQISSLRGTAWKGAEGGGERTTIQPSNGNCCNNSGRWKGVKMSFLWPQSFSRTERGLGTSSGGNWNLLPWKIDSSECKKARASDLSSWPCFAPEALFRGEKWKDVWEWENHWVRMRPPLLLFFAIFLQSCLLKYFSCIIFQTPFSSELPEPYFSLLCCFPQKFQSPLAWNYFLRVCGRVERCSVLPHYSPPSCWTAI